MRNVSYKSSRQNKNTHFILDNFFSEKRAADEIMWKSTAEPDTPQMTIQDNMAQALCMQDN
jgi:hypothetical protein